jgi:hypothetical protein
MNGYLTIQYPKQNQPDPGWTFIWHETDRPSHVANAKEKHVRTQFTLPVELGSGKPSKLLSEVSFCGGAAF